MVGQRHAHENTARFLDREFRQVWAVDRVTGGYHYLPDGMADQYRERAKVEWTCPVPGCDGPITTKGRTRRAHFAHLIATQHPGESEVHLAAKGMLKSWAEDRYPDYDVREEVRLKVDQFDANRQPDVLVTGSGRPIALEVEYKAFDPTLWSLKQDDLERIGVTTAWLIGHHRLRAVPDAVGPHGVAVRTTPLMRAIGARGLHVFAINPMTREVATLAGDRDFATKIHADTRYAWLWVHSLDDCEIDPTTGLATPGTRLIEAGISAEAARKAAEDERRREARERMYERLRREAEAARANRQATNRGQQPATLKVARPPRPEWVRRPSATSRWPVEQHQAWERATDRSKLLDLFGAVPEFITWHACTAEEASISALPDQWHAQVYLALIENQLPNRAVTTAMATEVVVAGGLAADNLDTRKAVAQYLTNLAQRGVLRRDGREFRTTAHGHLTPSGSRPDTLPGVP